MDNKMSVHDLWMKMEEIGLGGWIMEVEGERIRKEVEKLEPSQLYLEVGVAYGKSLATVSYYAKEGVGIFGVDVLDWGQREQNLEKLGVGGRANFIKGDSQWEAMQWDRQIDLLFIDGDHSYYGVMKDIASWIPHVKEGGRIMLHDYTNTSPGVQKAIHDFIYPSHAYDEFGLDGSLYHFTKRGRWKK